MKITLYGIKSCDTVRKARRFLDEQAIDYHFHDFRIDGLEPARVDDWLGQLDPDNPTLIKRPVLEIDGRIEVGFSPERYRTLLD